MVILIAGGTHTGKTMLAQRLLETAHWPYLSLDHLKMGLIRSGMTRLTPESSDGELTGLLWPIAREIAKTAIENGQNLVIEGCYIPFHYAGDFPAEYRAFLSYVCLVFSQSYLECHFDQILTHANCVEIRKDPSVNREELKRENARNLQACRANGTRCFLIDRPCDYDGALQTLCLELIGEASERGRRMP